MVDTARRGLSGATGLLPYRERIQESFGRHDVSQIRVGIGGAAGEASDRIGARAFTSGDRIAFRGDPDLRLAAHESAHVVQQRAGLELAGQVGRRGDRWETHASAVADVVARGGSAESLLDRVAYARASRQMHGPPMLQLDDQAGTKPTTTEKWFKLTLDSDTFYLGFRPVSGNASGLQDVDAIMQPYDRAHAYQWKQDELVQAEPRTRRISIEPTHMFLASSLGVYPEANAAVYTFDLTGDQKPDFAVRIDRETAATSRRFALRTNDTKSSDDFSYTVIDKQAPGSASRLDPTRADFAMMAGQDAFLVSFELLPSVVKGAPVRVTIMPANWSRVYQSQMRYWDVKGREVGKDDSYISAGNWSVEAAPTVKTAWIADREKFAPVLNGEYPEAGAGVWTFDLEGDKKPDFGVRIAWNVSKTIRGYDFTTRDDTGGGVQRFGYHYIQDDAWKYGYSGNIAPRRENNDILDDFGELLTSRHTWHFAITMIPVVGELVMLGEAIAGYTIFGDKLSTFERVVSALAALLPVAGGLVIKAVAKEGAAVARLAATVGRTEEEVIVLLQAAEKQSVGAKEVQEMRATLRAGGELTEAQVSTVQGMVRQIDADRRAIRAAAKEAEAEAEAISSATGTELKAGSVEHKAQRWAEYQARGGTWPYDRWSNVYEANMLRATKAHAAADAFHSKLGWGKREVTVDVDGVPRRLDIGDVATRRGVEIKTGPQYATQDNLWEVLRDEILVKERGWDISWHFTHPPSGPLKDALKRANIPFTVGPI